jgi:hypothetical protein
MDKRTAKKGIIRSVHHDGRRLEFLSFVVRLEVERKGG